VDLSSVGCGVPDDATAAPRLVADSLNGHRPRLVL